MRQAKPPFSLWLAAERKRHQLKVEELSDRLTKMGFEAAVPTVRTWEAGRVPRADTIEALERLFGTPAPREIVGGDSGDLAAAIRELTAYLREQGQWQRDLLAALASDDTGAAARLAAAAIGKARGDVDRLAEREEAPAAEARELARPGRR